MRRNRSGSPDVAAVTARPFASLTPDRQLLAVLGRVLAHAWERCGEPRIFALPG